MNSKESGGRQRETGDQSYTRRHVVATLAAGGAIAVAGCSGSDESGADTGTTARQASTSTPTGIEEQASASSTPTEPADTSTPTQATETATPTDTATPFPLPSRPEGYETPEPPAFEEPDEVRDGTEIFRGVPFEETPDGTLHLDLYLPADADSVPLVVHVHGGAWKGGERTWYQPWHAGQGIAAATIDYRLSGTAEYPAAVRDVAAATHWLRTYAAPAAGVDPERTALRGGSAGAHLAGLLAMAPNEDNFEPVGIDDPDTEVDAFIGISGIYNFDGDDDGETPPVIEQFFGCTRSECPDTFDEGSPIQHVDGDDPATFVWHGQADDVVPDDQTIDFRDELRDEGVPVTVLNPEEAGHVEMLEDPWREEFRTTEREFLSDELDL